MIVPLVAAPAPSWRAPRIEQRRRTFTLAHHSGGSDAAKARGASLGGTAEANAHLGMEQSDLEPDFATMGLDMGCVGISAISEPGEFRPALKATIREVKAGCPRRSA